MPSSADGVTRADHCHVWFAPHVSPHRESRAHLAPAQSGPRRPPTPMHAIQPPSTLQTKPGAPTPLVRRPETALIRRHLVRAARCVLLKSQSWLLLRGGAIVHRLAAIAQRQGFAKLFRRNLGLNGRRLLQRSSARIAWVHLIIRRCCPTRLRCSPRDGSVSIRYWVLFLSTAKGSRGGRRGERGTLSRWTGGRRSERGRTMASHTSGFEKAARSVLPDQVSATRLTLWRSGVGRNC